MTVCLGEQGFASVPYRGTERGYVPNSPIPPEGQLGFLKAERRCAERTGYGEPVREPDPAELESRYEEVISTKECLESEGYLVVETPSLSEFVQVRGAWDPYASLVAPDLGYIGDGEYLRLDRRNLPRPSATVTPSSQLLGRLVKRCRNHRPPPIAYDDATGKRSQSATGVG